jgi:mannosyltransferase OCH1-like enzyme
MERAGIRGLGVMPSRRLFRRVASSPEPTQYDADDLLIPRVFHQIWVGPDPLPEEFAAYQQTWLDHHPGWELRVWTDDNLPATLRRPEAAERLRVPAERADILRLELLWRFGGVYVDTDFECLRSLEPLIEDASFFVGLTRPGRVANSLLGSVAGHPVLDHALAELRPREYHGYDKEAAGPLFLTEIVFAHEDEVLFLEPEILHTSPAHPGRGSHAVHHEATSWKDVGMMRSRIEKLDQKVRRAEKAAELAREKAEQWRTRCKAAEADLDRLRRMLPYRLSRLPRNLLRHAGR